MTPELQEYYEDRFTLFACQGWRDLLEDVTNIVNNIDSLSSVKDEADLKYKQGQLDILNWILTLKQASDAAYDELTLGGS